MKSNEYDNNSEVLAHLNEGAAHIVVSPEAPESVHIIASRISPEAIRRAQIINRRNPHAVYASRMLAGRMLELAFRPNPER